MFYFLYYKVSRSLSAKIIYQVFPIHEKSQLQKLQKTWVQKFLDRQPIGKKEVKGLLGNEENSFFFFR